MRIDAPHFTIFISIFIIYFWMKNNVSTLFNCHLLLLSFNIILQFVRCPIETLMGNLISNRANTVWYKEWTKWNFVFVISQLKKHCNSKILVPTPHNTLVFFWDRERNFQVSMFFYLEIVNVIFLNNFLRSPFKGKKTKFQTYCFKL